MQFHALCRLLVYFLIHYVFHHDRLNAGNKNILSYHTLNNFSVPIAMINVTLLDLHAQKNKVQCIRHSDRLLITFSKFLLICIHQNIQHISPNDNSCPYWVSGVINIRQLTGSVRLLLMQMSHSFAYPILPCILSDWLFESVSPAIRHTRSSLTDRTDQLCILLQHVQFGGNGNIEYMDADLASNCTTVDCSDVSLCRSRQSSDYGSLGSFVRFTTTLDSIILAAHSNVKPGLL